MALKVGSSAPRVLKVRKLGMKSKPNAQSSARLDTFARGMIWGMHLAGMAREGMAEHLEKKDGAAVPLNTIDRVIAKKKADPEWRGMDSVAGGRPSTLTTKQHKQVTALIFRERGKTRVTIAYCKKKLPFLKRVHDTTVAHALHAAGLKWLTRRSKTWVPADSKQARLAYAQSVLKKHQSTLDRYAYTDGTCFYLARSQNEHDDKKRAGLGRHVWRMASGGDGLFDDNISPSIYAKAQGLPVKIWGFLANGQLKYYVLPTDPERASTTTHMNGDRYQKLIQSRFAKWRQECFADDHPVWLIQDHERCLWQERNIQQLKKEGCKVVKAFPKHSPDLNAIEGRWHTIRQKLLDTEPQEPETRAAFLVRLNRTVNWLNQNDREEALHICTNQKIRAQEVLALKGAKTRW